MATLRIEYEHLKDVPCICKSYTEMAVHVEKWLAVAITAHVLVMVFTVQTAVRTGVVLERSAACCWRWAILEWRRDFVLSLVCRKQRINERGSFEETPKFENQMTALAGRQWLCRVCLEETELLVKLMKLLVCVCVCVCV